MILTDLLRQQLPLRARDIDHPYAGCQCSDDTVGAAEGGCCTETCPCALRGVLSTTGHAADRAIDRSAGGKALRKTDPLANKYAPPATAQSLRDGAGVGVVGKALRRDAYPEWSPERPRFECGAACACEVDRCRHRRSQRGLARPIEVFATDTGAGWGARTLSDICAGDFVATYAGEVLPRSEARRRMRKYDEDPCNYLMFLREHVPSTGTVLVTHVDATLKGNASRFFNHSCDPNLVVHPVRTSFVPVVGFFANRAIAAGEELTFHYGGGGGGSGGGSNKESPRECGGELIARGSGCCGDDRGGEVAYGGKSKGAVGACVG